MKRTTALGIFAAVLALAGCSRSGDGPRGSLRSGGESDELTIKGSDTMVHLASSWAESFMKESPQVTVSVTGGGSGTGIAALLNGTTDLCASSREIAPKELDLAKQKKIEPQEFIVGRDGLAVIVHPENPVKELTLEQIKNIFTGKTTNWKAVGGPGLAIVVLSRESSSGTFVFFQEHVLQKQDYATSARLMPATAAIVQETASNRQAIGYVGLGYLDERVRAVNVKADSGTPGVEPSFETVRSGKYAIARPLYLYANGEPAGARKQFLDYCLSEAGQKIVKDEGYVTVK
jgi:phosphate transport system substrate-binding protein